MAPTFPDFAARRKAFHLRIYTQDWRLPRTLAQAIRSLRQVSKFDEKAV
jgi:hypothetical protein